MAEKLHVGFSTGELDPDLHDSVDVEAYDTALDTARNVVINRKGAIIERPTTQRLFEGSNTNLPMNVPMFLISGFKNSELLAVYDGDPTYEPLGGDSPTSNEREKNIQARIHSRWIDVDVSTRVANYSKRGSSLFIASEADIEFDSSFVLSREGKLFVSGLFPIGVDGASFEHQILVLCRPTLNLNNDGFLEPPQLEDYFRFPFINYSYIPPLSLTGNFPYPNNPVNIISGVTDLNPVVIRSYLHPIATFDQFQVGRRFIGGDDPYEDGYYPYKTNATHEENEGLGAWYDRVVLAVPGGSDGTNSPDLINGSRNVVASIEIISDNEPSGTTVDDRAKRVSFASENGTDDDEVWQYGYTIVIDGQESPLVPILPTVYRLFGFEFRLWYGKVVDTRHPIYLDVRVAAPPVQGEALDREINSIRFYKRRVKRRDQTRFVDVFAYIGEQPFYSEVYYEFNSLGPGGSGLANRYRNNNEISSSSEDYNPNAARTDRLYRFADDGTVPLDFSLTPPTFDILDDRNRPFRGIGGHGEVVRENQYGSFNPRHISVFNQRLVLSVDDRIETSQIGHYNNFFRHYPLRDSDALSTTISRNDATIRFLFPTQRGLIAFTNRGVEFKNPGFTPSSLGFLEGGEYVIHEKIHPLRTQEGIIYMDEDNVVRELVWSREFQSFVPGDISIYNNHLLEKTPTSWAFQPNDPALVWVAFGDKTMLSLNYLPSQKMRAWTRHDFKDVVEQVVTSQGEAYIVVRDDTGHRRVERFIKYRESGWSEYPMDGAVFIEGPVQVIDGNTQGNPLAHLEGEVSVVADGSVISSPNNPSLPTITVTNSTINLGKEYTDVYIGRPITSDAVTLNVNKIGRKNVMTQPLSNLEVYLNVLSTGELYVGNKLPDDDSTDGLKPISFWESSGGVIKLKDGVGKPERVNRRVSLSVPGDWKSRGRVAIRNVDPLSFKIVSVKTNIEEG